MVFSDNGIIAKAREAANKTNEAIINEQTQMNELADYMGNMLNTIGGGSTPEEPEKPIGGEYSDSEGVNTPQYYASQMTPIKWDSNTNDWVETTGDDPDWYDYSAKKWANAKTSDGSMWVWIPRYAYSITSGYHTSTTGTIEVEFMKGTSKEGSTDKSIVEYNSDTTSNYTQFPNGYVIHPAFNYGEEVSGLWVAKFEASHTGCTTDVSTGETNTDSTSLTLQVKPGVTSWRNITISNMYDVCLEYNTLLNSHLMKNDEWGAVAYLSKSKYGKENEEVWINNSSSFITGSAGNSASAGIDEGTTNDYTSEQGAKASTTGNVYGTYDMSGGTWERVAGYINNENENLMTYGSSLVKGDAKTKNVYIKASTDDPTNNYNQNSGKYGDAVYETSSNSTSPWNLSWYADYSRFPSLSDPFFIRGGCYIDATTVDATVAGVFYFGYNNGYSSGSDISFRPVLVAL